MSRIWGKLTRVGGVEDSLAVPAILSLSEKDSYFGRFSKPTPRPDQPFTHTTQHVISCMFVSATHFAILRDDNVQPAKYFIRDFSRNGTFLNSDKIGLTDAKELNDGDLITLKYKDKDKIIFKFTLLPDDSSIEAMPPPPTAATMTSKEPVKAGFPLKRTESVSEVFTQQISTLQTEVKRLENKLSLLNDQYELLKKENDKIDRKSRQDEKHIQEQKQELEEQKDRIQSLESTNTALDARNRKLQESYDDLLTEYKELKSKNQYYQTELEEKNQSLESLRHLMDDQNKAMTSEKRSRVAYETQLQEYLTKIQLYEEKNVRLIAANQALQEIVHDLEGANQKLQASLTERERYIHQITIISEHQQKRLVEMKKKYGESINILQALQHSMQQFEEIPSPSFMNDGGDYKDNDREERTEKPLPSGIGTYSHRLQQLEQGDLFPMDFMRPHDQQDTLDESIQVHLPKPIPILQDDTAAETSKSIVKIPTTTYESTQAGHDIEDVDDDSSSDDDENTDEEKGLDAMIGQKPAEMDFYFHDDGEEDESRNIKKSSNTNVAKASSDQSKDRSDDTSMPPPSTTVTANRSLVDRLQPPFQDELIAESKAINVKEPEPPLISQDTAIRKSDASRISELTPPTQPSKDVSPSHADNESMSKTSTPIKSSDRKSKGNEKSASATRPTTGKPLSQALTPSKNPKIPLSQQSASSVNSKRRSNNKRTRALSEESSDESVDQISTDSKTARKRPKVAVESVKSTPSKPPNTRKATQSSSSSKTEKGLSQKTKLKDNRKASVQPEKILELFEEDDNDEEEDMDIVREKQNTKSSIDSNRRDNGELQTVGTINSMTSSVKSFPNNQDLLHQKPILNEDEEDRQRTAFDF